MKKSKFKLISLKFKIISMEILKIFIEYSHTNLGRFLSSLYWKFFCRLSLACVCLGKWALLVGFCFLLSRFIQWNFYNNESSEYLLFFFNNWHTVYLFAKSLHREQYQDVEITLSFNCQKTKIITAWLFSF